MKRIIIYGINMEAQQLYAYLKNDGFDVAHFMVDEAFKKSDYLLGLEVLTTEHVFSLFDRSLFSIIISFGYKNLVKNRERFHENCVSNGFEVISYISSKAMVFSEDIGEGSIVMPGSVIAPGVKLGKGVFIEIGCNIAHHSTLGDFCFLAPAATICGNVKIGNNCFIGANATIINNIEMAREVIVAAGAIVRKDCAYKDVVYAPRQHVVPNKSQDISI